MTAIHITGSRRPPWAALTIAALALLALAYALGGALAALLALLALAAAALVVCVPPRRRAGDARLAPREQLLLTGADGVARQAIVAPVEQSDGRRLVLTAEGYQLLDADGRVIYRLRPPA